MVIPTGGTVNLAEGIIDDTQILLFIDRELFALEEHFWHIEIAIFQFLRLVRKD